MLPAMIELLHFYKALVSLFDSKGKNDLRDFSECAASVRLFFVVFMDAGEVVGYLLEAKNVRLSHWVS